MPTQTTHSDGCSTCFPQSDYDRNCPRCKQIWRVIQLRRRIVANGVSWQESQLAEKLADGLAAEYQLTPTEALDRLWAKPINHLKPLRGLNRQAEVILDNLDADD
jgi:hypothetical protein